MADFTKPRILLVDDEEGIRRGLSRLFEREGFSVESAEDREGALRIAESCRIDLAVLDVRLNLSSRGTDLISVLKASRPELPIVMITGYGSIESAVDAMKLGASDYILKPIDNSLILHTIRAALEKAYAGKGKTESAHESRRQASPEIISGDARFLNLVALADRIKDSQASILITGESGTGKEVIARYIHYSGARRDGPFVDLNCAAISESLLLSELFGHEKGAFTGAVGRQIGKFELADKGTLFLDEIGDMSLEVQAKLLRVIEESQFERVGGARKIHVDIRIIAATNKKLRDLMRLGLFREDLFYRINIVNIDLPPIRERPGDIPLLADYFLRKYASKYDKPLRSLSPRLLEKWTRKPWPGNVRELQNAVNQAVLLSSGSVLDDESAELRPEEPLAHGTDAIDVDRFVSLKDLQEAVTAHYERKLIENTLHSHKFNKSRTAEALDVTRKTLIKKIAEYSIEPRLERPTMPKSLI